MECSHDENQREIEMRDAVLPEHTNPNGTLFGGKLLEMMDKAAGICAATFAGSRVVTASFEAVDFLIPVFLGQILCIKTKVIYSYRTSMVVSVEVTAEDVIQQTRELCCTAHVNMVAVDQEGNRVIVPSVEPRTKEEMDEYERGQRIRRQALTRIGKAPE
jgi:acyl-CoA hydrolase